MPCMHLKYTYIDMNDLREVEISKTDVENIPKRNYNTGRGGGGHGYILIKNKYRREMDTKVRKVCSLSLSKNS